jgi:hypothetical protein
LERAQLNCDKKECAKIVLLKSGNVADWSSHTQYKNFAMFAHAKLLAEKQQYNQNHAHKPMLYTVGKNFN